ncbi:MAG: aspartate kinase [Candidatus Bathyarchaeota archaeon]|nr:MAG: aspartate kinase [Candidatus Bathyarchaeota archaeon]
MDLKGKLSVVKFGGSLLDPRGKNIPTLLKRIRELKNRYDLGPIVVLSAPNGFTDKLIGAGESYSQSKPVSIDSIFSSYEGIAKTFVKGRYLKQLLSELVNYRDETYEVLTSINKRFHGNAKAKVLTSGGELPFSVLVKYIMRANGLNACHISKEHWPVVTDDNFENATPLYETSKKRINYLIEPLEEGKVVSQAGFLGVTSDGLETILGRGGSDLTAVFISCLLQKRYEVETLLFKGVSVQSADPLIVGGQKTEHVTSLSYNEAQKASIMGMKIVQGIATATARRFKQPIKLVPIHDPARFTVIRSEGASGEIVKCVTGKSGCAILSMNDEKSRSLEDSLRIWESRNDFLDLGTETLETGKRIRDFLFLDSDFIRKNEERLKGFDENLTIEYGIGVVTLIGDRMKGSPGVASIAIGAMPDINIKRGIFAPHTSQIILVIEEKNVEATVAAIHLKREKMNRLR